MYTYSPQQTIDDVKLLDELELWLEPNTQLKSSPATNLIGTKSVGNWTVSKWSPISSGPSPRCSVSPYPHSPNGLISIRMNVIVNESENKFVEYWCYHICSLPSTWPDTIHNIYYNKCNKSEITKKCKLIHHLTPIGKCTIMPSSCDQLIYWKIST